MAMFVQQLLSRGYGFDERAFGRVTFQKKVGAGWVGPVRRGAGPGAEGRGLQGFAEAEAMLLTCRRGTPRSAGRLATC